MDAGTCRRRVVIVPFPLQGHTTPMLQLGTILHVQGFSVTVLHPEYNSPDSSNHPEFTFLPLSDNLSGNEKIFLSSNAFHFTKVINKNCRSSIREHLARLQELQGGVACVVYDSTMEVADSVARDLDVPSIMVRTSSAANLMSYSAIVQLHRQNLIPLPESQLEDLVPSLEFLRFKDLPFPLGAEMPEIILDYVRSISTVRSYKAVVLNTIESLEESALVNLHQHYQVPFFSIGPLHKMASSHNPTSLMKEDISCMKWLEKQSPNSVMYVSLGSLSNIDQKELMETAWGLIGSEQPFLWVIRPNSINGSDWTECLSEGLMEKLNKKGCIVKWAPQKEILAHPAVGAFFTHCGWNSTLEGVSEGVPMLCRPSLVDQLTNARYISQVWKVGFELENARDRTVVKDAIRRALVDEESKEMRQRSLDLKLKLEVSMQKGGFSYNSIENLTQFILSL